MSKQETQIKPQRRRYAASFKSELVARSLQPGASVSGIALENGINANVLFKWRRQHVRATSNVSRESIEQAVLLPVKLVAAVTPSVKEATTQRPLLSEGVIEIDIGAARVRLRGAVDEANVRYVLQALRAIA
jgi:transposase